MKKLKIVKEKIDAIYKGLETNVGNNIAGFGYPDRVTCPIRLMGEHIDTRICNNIQSNIKKCKI